MDEGCQCEQSEGDSGYDRVGGKQHYRADNGDSVGKGCAEGLLHGVTSCTMNVSGAPAPGTGAGNSSTGLRGFYRLLIVLRFLEDFDELGD